MLSYIEKSQIANQITSNIRNQHCFLFIGNKATNEEITENICKLRWSAIFYDSDNFEIAKKFELNERSVQVFSLSERKKPSPNKQEIPFITLSDEDRTEIQFSLNDILKNYLKNLCHLYIIGFDFEDELLNVLKRRIFNGMISFFGVGEGDSDALLSLKNTYDFKIYEETFDEIIENSIDDYSTEYENEESNLYFFSNNMQYSIPKIDLIGIHGIVTLLNRNLIENNIPIGKATQSRAFEKFLESSTSDGPQWYAYSKETNFIVEREFKKAMFSITNAALENRKMPDNNNYDGSNPIAIMGESSSSKSIMLGAIATEIFNEHKYPVLFINSTNLSLSIDNSSDVFDKINSLMERIEKYNSETKILLIWDCSALQINSAYGSRKEAQSLNRYLVNRGRRFVLLYSCYEHDLSENKKSYDFLPNKNSFYLLKQNSNYEKTDLYFDREEWIVQASRKLSDNEIDGIKKLFKEYGSVDPSSKFWEEEKKHNSDLFSYFYHLTILLQEPLKEHFFYERSYFHKYYNNHLKKIFDNYKFKSGIHFDDKLFELLGISIETNSEEDEINKKLDDFQKCVAIFSQFYIKTPRSLALSFIDDSSGNIYYSSESRDIYLFAENEIPWIKSIEYNGTFYFTFRSNDEATIFLEDNLDSITPEQKEKSYLNLIIRILDQYLKIAKENGIGDNDIVWAIVILLRQIGPNSQKRTCHWNYIQKNLNIIIDKLEEIVKSGYDVDCSFKLTLITFTREFYSKFLRSENSNEKIINSAIYQLKNTLTICNEAIDTLKANTYNSSRNMCDQLINEKVQCNILIIDCLNNSDFISDFSILFSEVEKIIYRNPENGFFYNSLFKLFETWKNMKYRNENAILRYSSHLANIIDLMNSYDIYHRDVSGSDELSLHISKFQTTLAGLNNIRIEEFEKKLDLEFIEIYNNSTFHDQASYIWLVCYNELNTEEMKCLSNPQTNDYNVIPDNVCERCREIYKFIDKYYDVVKANGSALQLMLRIFWIWKTKSELRLKGALNECRLTKFTLDEWTTINRICYDYCKLNSDSNISPFMKYMKVLSLTSTQKLETANDIREIVNQLREIDESSFMALRRMYTPFVLCNDDGTPRCFTGKVTDKKGKSGKVTLSTPKYDNLVFNENNLRSKNNSHTNVGTLRTDLVIGIGYTRPQVYSYDYVMEKENRRKEQKND